MYHYRDHIRFKIPMTRNSGRLEQQSEKSAHIYQLKLDFIVFGQARLCFHWNQYVRSMNSAIVRITALPRSVTIPTRSSIFAISGYVNGGQTVSQCLALDQVLGSAKLSMKVGIVCILRNKGKPNPYQHTYKTGLSSVT